MKKETSLTVYKNELNTVPFRKFNAVEMDLFFSICSKMREKGLEEVFFSFDELKKISNYDRKSNVRFVYDLKNTYTKLLNLKYSNRYINQENKDIEECFILFTGFVINRTDEYIKIKINPDLKHILNEITNNFTKFELEEFTELRSSYSKTAFRFLKQFRQTGFWKISVGEFREIFDVPNNYRISDIDKRVLFPIKKELSLIFKNLQIKKITAKKSRKIEYLEFKFKAEDDMNKRNEKTFRDSDGNYYQKDLFHLTPDEENKAFPTIKQK